MIKYIPHDVREVRKEKERKMNFKAHIHHLSSKTLIAPFLRSCFLNNKSFSFNDGFNYCVKPSSWMNHSSLNPNERVPPEKSVFVIKVFFLYIGSLRNWFHIHRKKNHPSSQARFYSTLITERTTQHRRRWWGWCFD